MIASLIFKPKYKSNINRALIKLDISSLEHNLDVLNQIKNKECVIMATVKADAYGHGTKELRPYLNRYGIKDFAMASLDEALELRRNGIIENILILGYVYHKVKIYDLTVSITSYEHTRILNDRKSGLNAIFR
ncbi:MAG: alanine racemase [Erysipelotrichaceae bacterium]|nr:alanine racemase [Erysipelotrichaceae bacterium]